MKSEHKTELYFYQSLFVLIIIFTAILCFSPPSHKEDIIKGYKFELFVKNKYRVFQCKDLGVTDE